MSDEGLSDNERLIAAVRRNREQAALRERELAAARHELKISRTKGPLVYTASCSCGLWALEDQKLSHPLDADAVRILVGPRHAEHVLKVAERRVELGYSEGRCTPVKVTGADSRVGYGMMCGRRGGRKRCQFCKTRWADSQCDYPMGGNCRKCQGAGVRDGYNCHDCAGTGRAMCNKHVCSRCRAHREPDEDYCPDHRERAGFARLLVREVCVWLGEARFSGKCVHRGCERVVAAGERALWFPERRRLMCEECGDLYLKVSVDPEGA